MAIKGDGSVVTSDSNRRDGNAAKEERAIDVQKILINMSSLDVLHDNGDSGTVKEELASDMQQIFHGRDFPQGSVWR